MKSAISRRYFLYASLGATLSQILGGCSNSATITQILFLENSIPVQLIKDFQKTLKSDNKTDFQPQNQFKQIFDSLTRWQQSKNEDKKTQGLIDKILNRPIIYPSVTSLGDFWLSDAIEQNLIKPLAINNLAGWQKLPKTWQQLVQRNQQGYLTQEGTIWGAPYRWGSTVIAYQSKKLEKLNITIKDWQDLWQPELRDRLSLLDSYREVIGLTLKKMGYSYNTQNINSISNLEKELLALHKQTKLYSSDRYLEPLVLGDTLVAVAWSSDILPILKQYPEIKFIIPPSGTSLWADIWVEPQISQVSNKDHNQALINSWIDFCWQSKAAQQISLFTSGISPITRSLKRSELSTDLQDNVFINSEVLYSEKSEFLLPLEPAINQQYRDLWLKIRQ
ncbi:periplasmic polyamine-binding protein [Chondrocystis sp. NIES-4102]|nr:periplasmic polyamine-binding protein [Chondrocystis sp. NIES-4102]